MRLFIIIAIHLFMSSVLFSANNYEWINCTEGLEGTYGLNLFIFENKIYDYTLNIVSNDTGKTWQANKYNITANDGNTYLIYLNFYNFFKYRNKYVGLGANNWLSNDMINWYSIGKFNGVPSGHSVTNIFATDSTFLIQTFSQNKYKTFLTKDTSNLIFHPIENDLPSNYKVLDYSYIYDTLYATSASPFYIATYYYSTDGGVNWQHDSIANIVDPISYIKYLNNKYYIISRRHLWAQDDEGNWFECQSDSLIKPQERTILISYKDKIITNTEINDVNMLIASDDGGKTWRRFGTSNFYIKQLLAMGDKLIANTFNGIQISTDDGKTWVESNKGIFKSNLRAENQWHKFVSYNNEIMTASRNYMIDNTIMKSYDNGKTWVKKIIDPSFIEEKNKRRISDFRYFVVGTDLGVFALNYYDAVYKTNDFGETWEKYSDNTGYFLRDYKNTFICNDTLFYYDNVLKEIFYSTDYGKSFLQLEHSYKESLPDKCWHWALIDGTFYAINKDFDLYVSNNEGRDWTYSTTFDFPISESQGPPAIQFIDGNRIYYTPYSGLNKSLYATDDFGKTWEEINLPIPKTAPSTWVRCKDNIYILYLSQYETLIYTSKDNGKTWELVSEGLGSKTITDIFSDGNNFFASTYEGLYKLVTNPDAVEDNEPLYPIEFYPMPADNKLNIKNNYFNIKDVKIYDILGKEHPVDSFNNSYINIENLKQGVYIATIYFENNWFITKKFIKN